MMKWKKIAALLLILFLQSCALADKESEELDSFIREKTKEWEIIYGDYRLWRYDVLADFGAKYGSVAGPNFSNGAVPISPGIEDISEKEAIAFAIQYLPQYNGKVQKDQLLQCFISSRFSKDVSEYSYISQDGSWIIGFWNKKDSDLELLCYVYINGLNGNGEFAYFPDDAVYVGSPENAEKIKGS